MRKKLKWGLMIFTIVNVLTFLGVGINLFNLNNEKTIVASTLEATTNNIANLNESISLNEEAITSKTNTLETNTAKINSLNEEINKAEQLIESNSGIIETLQAEIEEIVQSIAKLTEKN